MRRLILMRHAKSDWSFAGASDHDRPLNARGEASAVALGDWLRAKGYHPEEALCSSARRTGDTLTGLNLDPQPRIAFTRALYLAEAEEMRMTLRAASATCVLMLGHNPGICEFAHRLVDDPPDHIRFEDYPTGATTVIDFDIGNWDAVEWHRGTAIDFAVPREL